MEFFQIKIVRPGLDRVLFLPERPYLPPGTLRELLLRTGQERVISDDQILATLHALELDHVVIRAGGLDVETDVPSQQARKSVIKLLILNGFSS